MKRKFITALILLATLLPQLMWLSSCKEEEKPAPSSPKKYTGEGSNLMENDLFGKMPSELYTLFADAVRDGVDISEGIGAYNLSAALSGKRRLSLKDGIFAFSEGGTVMCAASLAYGDVRFVTLSEDGSDYVLSESVASTNTAVFEWLPKTKTAIDLAEEYFELPKISENDASLGDDFVYYLTETYAKGLVETAFAAYRCTELGVLPNELEPSELEKIEKSASEFAEKTELKIGFGLKMNRVESVKLVFSADGVAEYTEGGLDCVSFDVTVRLDSSGKRLSSLEGEISERSASFGNVAASFDITTVFNTGGELVHISADIDTKSKGVKIGEELVEDEKKTVLGNRETGIKIKFSPLSKIESIDLRISDISYREGVADTAYSNIAYAVRAGAFGNKNPAELSVSYSIDGVKMTLGGEAVTGEAAEAIELPEKVKSLLGTG